MAIDTPARIAILGAGPIGLEAALYARFLGYEVVVFEAGEVAESVRRWGSVRMFTPFGMNRSPLGLAAIQAQDENYCPPADDELLTGHEWADRYLLPLSQTDLLADCLRLQTTVLKIGKAEMLKGDLPGQADRGDFPFRLLVRDSGGESGWRLADAVIDASGVFGQTNYLGHGGIPAVGELAWRSSIGTGLPILGRETNYAGRHTLLIGGGYSAATNAVALAQLAREVPGTRVTWITRREGCRFGGWTDRLDSLATGCRQRSELARQANALTTDPASGSHVLARHGGRTDRRQGAFPGGPRIHRGTFRPPCGLHIHLTAFIANVGYHPNTELYQELQVHECYASQGPMKLAAALLGQASADCLDQQACGPQTLLNPEPNFYILGAKSYGRKSNFLLSVGLEQIREVFTIIGDRPTLDLYAGAHKLLR